MKEENLVLDVKSLTSHLNKSYFNRRNMHPIQEKVITNNELSSSSILKSQEPASFYRLTNNNVIRVTMNQSLSRKPNFLNNTTGSSYNQGLYMGPYAVYFIDTDPEFFIKTWDPKKGLNGQLNEDTLIRVVPFITLCQLILAPITDSHERKLGLEDLNKSRRKVKLNTVLSFVTQYINDYQITYHDINSVIKHIDSKSNGGLTERITYYLVLPFNRYKMKKDKNAGATFIKDSLKNTIFLYGENVN